MSKSGRWLLAGIGAGVLCILPPALLQAFVIPTGAMEDTLLIGDHIAMPRFSARHPVRSDIVIFPYPVDPAQTFVKRLIGVPGDRIRIANKQTYLNGIALNEPYVNHKTDYVDSYRDNFPSEPNVKVDPRALDMLRNHVVNGEVVVPPNSYFVMGDNRDSSLDSRYWGFVPEGSVLGRPLFIYWSVDRGTLSTQTRWGRTFRLIQ